MIRISLLFSSPLPNQSDGSWGLCSHALRPIPTAYVMSTLPSSPPLLLQLSSNVDLDRYTCFEQTPRTSHTSLSIRPTYLPPCSESFHAPTNHLACPPTSPSSPKRFRSSHIRPFKSVYSSPSFPRLRSDKEPGKMLIPGIVSASGHDQRAELPTLQGDG